MTHVVVCETTTERSPGDGSARRARGVSEKPPMAERILNAANRLFYQKGIRAIGVDAIAAEAGISKRSLYDTFPSKEALIAAYLQRRMLPIPPSEDPPLQKVLS